MSLRLSLAAILITAFTLPIVEATARSLGCTDPVVISNALKKVTDTDWQNISETSLQSMWPAELGGADCRGGACQTLWRKDRIIDDKCECCELFKFDVDRDDKANAIKERFYGIMIYYSADGQSEVLNAARMFARALGLSDSDVATIGRNPQEKFMWNVDGKQQQIALMEVQLMRQQRTWEVYISLSRHPEHQSP